MTKTSNEYGNVMWMSHLKRPDEILRRKLEDNIKTDHRRCIVRRIRYDGTDSGSCLMTGFCIPGTEPRTLFKLLGLFVLLNNFSLLYSLVQNMCM
jgi:hypothetical protein